MKLTLTLLCFLIAIPAFASDRERARAKARAAWAWCESCKPVEAKPVPKTPVVQPGQKASDIAATEPAPLAPGMHSHQCPNGNCGTVWSHYPGGSHNCPSCGTFQNVQMSGSTQQRVEYAPQRRSIFRRGGG